MDTILDNFASDKLFPNSNLLDLEDLNETDFLTNVHFSEQMEDFSNELFNSFFDEHLLVERNPLLDMELDPPNPDIQTEHSYSLSGDSAPQSPSMSIKMDDDAESEGMWSFSQDLTAILVKQEPNLLTDTPPPAVAPVLNPASQPLNLAPPPQRKAPEEKSSKELNLNPAPAIKAEPREVNQFLTVPTDEHLQLPPTPPSSHGSDSDGSQSPHSLPPSSPARLQARTSAAISSSPLLTAPHKLQGTSGPLILTEEEKRTLIAEGYPVPNKLPLTKTEEKALKRVRRKIKNKISAQESRRKKKEYVECLEKKVENYTSENNELWRKVETLESANRSLLQQLQKLQALVSGKVPRSYKIASTQTGTCLMVVALCFVLVVGSLVPCLPEFSSTSYALTSDPLPSPDLYTISQVRSRSLLFYDEGSALEDGHGAFLSVEGGDGWEGAPFDLGQDHAEQAHETSKYLSETQSDPMAYNNRTGAPFHHKEEQYHKRVLTSSSSHIHLTPSHSTTLNYSQRLIIPFNPPPPAALQKKKPPAQLIHQCTERAQTPRHGLCDREGGPDEQVLSGQLHSHAGVVLSLGLHWRRKWGRWLMCLMREDANRLHHSAKGQPMRSNGSHAEWTSPEALSRISSENSFSDRLTLDRDVQSIEPISERH
ncbi:cyclic AMP-responsive element-binding protein 3-like protein 1 [Chanos chanos]|uniref:Cyclic AMP-responsive element-binding protein 3-like protein 1 n=1 Tax=Chanos chanos TaxID=29144 RepID=A0A6J2WZB6_CHACN|nr:cyclic AMP-responsive element-binding protein 3-like protein 1 [Chanos chanos]